ncbi:MAG: hypothetical protein GY940_03405 [bacterium]|nr:hypothetical protein [bacterium]
MKILSKEDILQYLQELSDEMGKEGLKGEILVFGGAAMVLAFNARPSTRDVDAIFQPKSKIYELSKKIAERHQLPGDWLNDSVKGFVRSNSFDYELLIRHQNLSVYIPEPEYLLAMKSISMRIGIESSDIDDIKFLVSRLKLEKIDDIFKIIKKYYPRNQIPQKTYYAIEEIFQDIL